MNKIPMPFAGTTFEQVITQEWYRNFINNTDVDGRARLTAAANYIDVERLLDLLVLKLTFEVLGKSEEEIRVKLGLPEMTAAERELVREHYPWVFGQQQSS